MRREVWEEPDISDVAGEWEVPPDIGEGPRDERKIHSISEVPLLGDCKTGSIYFLEVPVLVEGTITALTGDAGSGKSTFASALARRAHDAGRPVLILDRENPKVAIDDRFARLGMSDDATFHVWGGWIGEEAPQPGSTIVLEWITSCEPRPIIIVDSVSAFYGGDQNSASEMRAFMNQCRRLADLGATVVVIHHDGKAESAKDYRGSSDFKAACDQCFHVTNFGEPGRLDKLVLRCFKSRFGFGGELSYQYANGQLVRSDAAEVHQTVSEQFTTLLRLNPGVTGKQFEDLAHQHNLGRNRARNFLSEGIHSKAVWFEPGAKGGRRYFLAGTEAQS